MLQMSCDINYSIEKIIIHFLSLRCADPRGELMGHGNTGVNTHSILETMINVIVMMFNILYKLIQKLPKYCSHSFNKVKQTFDLKPIQKQYKS